MLSTRWDHPAGRNRMQEEMARLFDDWSFRNRPAAGAAFPPMNLWEDDDHLYLEAELPGFSLESVEIYVTGGNQLSISGQRDRPQLENSTWHRQERAFGSFSRMFELPCDVDSDNVGAEFVQGVLTITLPKSEAAKPRKIEVKTS